MAKYDPSLFANGSRLLSQDTDWYSDEVRDPENLPLPPQATPREPQGARPPQQRKAPQKYAPELRNERGELDYDRVFEAAQQFEAPEPGPDPNAGLSRKQIAERDHMIGVIGHKLSSGEIDEGTARALAKTVNARIRSRTDHTPTTADEWRENVFTSPDGSEWVRGVQGMEKVSDGHEKRSKEADLAARLQMDAAKHELEQQTKIHEYQLKKEELARAKEEKDREDSIKKEEKQADMELKRQEKRQDYILKQIDREEEAWERAEDSRERAHDAREDARIAREKRANDSAEKAHLGDEPFVPKEVALAVPYQRRAFDTDAATSKAIANSDKIYGTTTQPPTGAGTPPPQDGGATPPLGTDVPGGGDIMRKNKPDEPYEVLKRQMLPSGVNPDQVNAEFRALQDEGDALDYELRTERIGRDDPRLKEFILRFSQFEQKIKGSR